MIDPLTESLLSLQQASDLCPPRRCGKRPHRSCLYRWTTTGCRGVVLDSIQIGGTRCTSREALSRFFRELTHQEQTGRPPIPIRSQHRHVRQTEADLDAAGF